MPTTYTFVIRHEPYYSDKAPGVTPSEAIIAQHPLTLMICGHTHTYEHKASHHTVIVGNGGAPLTSNVDYGYVIARQRADGAMFFTARDYASLALIDTFAVHPDGSPAAL